MLLMARTNDSFDIRMAHAGKASNEFVVPQRKTTGYGTRLQFEQPLHVNKFREPKQHHFIESPPSARSSNPW